MQNCKNTRENQKTKKPKYFRTITSKWPKQETKKRKNKKKKEKKENWILKRIIMFFLVFWFFGFWPVFALWALSPSPELILNILMLFPLNFLSSSELVGSIVSCSIKSEGGRVELNSPKCFFKNILMLFFWTCWVQCFFFSKSEKLVGSSVSALFLNLLGTVLGEFSATPPPTLDLTSSEEEHENVSEEEH